MHLISPRTLDPNTRLSTLGDPSCNGPYPLVCRRFGRRAGLYSLSLYCVAVLDRACLYCVCCGVYCFCTVCTVLCTAFPFTACTVLRYCVCCGVLRLFVRSVWTAMFSTDVTNGPPCPVLTYRTAQYSQRVDHHVRYLQRMEPSGCRRGLGGTAPAGVAKSNAKQLVGSTLCTRTAAFVIDSAHFRLICGTRY